MFLSLGGPDSIHKTSEWDTGGDQTSEQANIDSCKVFTHLVFHVLGTEVVKKQFDSEVDGLCVSIGVPLQNAVVGSLYQNAQRSVNIRHRIEH